MKQTRTDTKEKPRTVAAPAHDTPHTVSITPTPALFIALLFFSGVASLIYQVIWIKQLALIVGVDVYAVTTGVSAFFAGLAFGGWYWGRRTDRTQRPLALYAKLEVGIALLGVGATLILAHMAPLFVVAEMRAGYLAWLLPFAVIGIPAMLMGGTLPALMSALAPRSGKVARSGGFLYAANTLGAAAGALLTTFALILALGVQGTALAAAAINVILAATAAIVTTRQTQTRDKQATTQNAAMIQNHLPLALYAIAGGIALGYEIVWSQSIVVYTSTRSFAFATVLATYLLGLVIGSALHARYADRVRDPWGVFAILISLAGFVALLQVALSGGWLLTVQHVMADRLRASSFSETTIMTARFAIAALCTIFIPTLLLGAAFPAALRLCAGAAHIGRDIGRVLALNTIGGIAGTFIAGFILVPQLGLVRTMCTLALAAAASALIAIWRGSQVSRRAKAITALIAACSLAVALLVPADALARLQVVARGGQLVSYEESPGGTVSVVQQGKGEMSFRRLYVQGVSNSGDGIASLRYMRLQALLPLIIHNGKEEPRSALVIALGTGITAGALTQYPSLEKRVTAELLPAVVRATPLFQGNYDVATDPHSEIRIRDGRNELLRNPQHYDLITLEPPPPSAAGVVNLYSRDFYELARTRLNPNGLFAQWLPIATQNDEDTRSLVRSFLDVFPYATLWTTELHEMLLVGSMEPQQLDATAITARFNQPTVATSLAETGIDTPAALLATYICDRAALDHYVDNAPAVTDNRPLIEYARWVRPDEIRRALPKLLALQTEPLLLNATPALLMEIRRRRSTLMDFYNAGLFAYSRDRAAWVTAITRVMEAEPKNPYYRKITGQ